MKATSDLTTTPSLAAALDEAGTWDELSRRSGIPASTLKARGERLGVRLTTTDTRDEWDDLDAELNEPILSLDDFEDIEEWVASNVSYLLHEAAAQIEAAVDDETSAEMAEKVICARMTQRLTELIYKTHGVSRGMLWDLGWPHNFDLNGVNRRA